MNRWPTPARAQEYMQQFFISRDGAVWRLFGRKRQLMDEAALMESVESTASRAAAIEDVDRLVLDIRAGRIEVFVLADSTGELLRIYIL
ncbi:hypothetical protein [Paraburkholderia sp. WC7.3g]|uniref:hypothetical protein n=1 Tax=Paraburkholderia sp. WC7.3g TaxID=2991070 RepID=UPI003D23560C